MRFTKTLRCTTSAAAVAMAAFGVSGVAQAQDQDTQVTRVDEIIVTAQLREQSLQEVPIVVTSLSQEVLQGAGVRDIKDLQILTPGMTVTSTQSEASTTARIRGVGTVGDNPGLESSVGVVIDGVYRSRNGVGFGDLGELQRIEVLKGPQGTLFGKNTSAGVINIITEAPSFNPGFEAEITGGNYGAFGVAGSVTGPISETVAGRLYIATRERDGFYDVDVAGGPRTRTDDANQDFWTVRGQLLILPNDNTSIRIIADYTDRDEFCCVGVQTRVGPTQGLIAALTGANGPGTALAPPQFPAFNRQAYSNRDTNQRMEDRGISAEVNVDLPSWDAVFTSVTSYRDWSTVNGMDLDYTGADILYREDDGQHGTEIRNMTQEFRLAGTTDRLDWLVGLFATHEKIDRRDSYFFGPHYNAFISGLITANLANAGLPGAAVRFDRLGCFSADLNAYNGIGISAGDYLGGCLVNASPLLAPSGAVNIVGQGVADFYEQESTSIALFTNNTFRVTDQFDITLGLRYTWDDKSIYGEQSNINGNGAACAGVLANQAVIAGLAMGALPGAEGASAAQKLIGIQCLPWTNPLYNGRTIDESADDGELSGTLKAAFRPTDDLMVYASFARGYKGAGYNMDRVATGVIPDASLYFPAETVDSYELGLKATLADGSLLFNATYFNQTFSDFQLNTFLGTAFVVESIPELTSSGVDLDLVWFAPIEGLTFQGGLTYTDTKYGNFTAADLSSPGRFPQLSLLPGARAAFAPEWSVSGAVSFDRSLGHGLRGGFNLSAKYQTEYNTGSDLIPYKMQDAFTVVNGRVSIGSENGTWALDLWAQNLLDEGYTQVAYNAPLQGDAFPQIVAPQPNGTFYDPTRDTQTINAFLGAPRTYGLTLRLRY